MSVIVSAVFKAKPGKEGNLESVLKAIIPEVQAEKGAVQYALHRAANDNSQFFFYEKYADQNALNYHMATPHLQGLLKSIDGLVAENPVIEIYEEIAAIKR